MGFHFTCRISHIRLLLIMRDSYFSKVCFMNVLVFKLKKYPHDKNNQNKIQVAHLNLTSQCFILEYLTI